MALPPEKLPRDPDKLIEIIHDLRGEVEMLRTSVTKLKAMIFGARSERSAVIIAEQLALGLGDVEAQAVLPAPANDDGPDGRETEKAGSRKKPTRNIGALPAHLPRFDIVIEPETKTCSCCAGALRRIGEDVNEVLDRIPAVLRVLRMTRPKYACRACEGEVVQAKARPRLIEGGMASTALVSRITLSDGLVIAAFDGLPSSASRLP